MRSLMRRPFIAALVVALPAIMFVEQAKAGGRHGRRSCAPRGCYSTPICAASNSCGGCSGSNAAAPIASSVGQPQGMSSQLQIGILIGLPVPCTPGVLQAVIESEKVSLKLDGVTDIGLSASPRPAVGLTFKSQGTSHEEWGYLVDPATGGPTTDYVYASNTLWITGKIQKNADHNFYGAANVTVTVGSTSTGTSTSVCYKSP